MDEMMLDIDGAWKWLEAHGMPYTFRQVQRMASNHKLPFRRGPDGKRLFVPQSALQAFLTGNPTPPKKELWSLQRRR